MTKKSVLTKNISTICKNYQIEKVSNSRAYTHKDKQIIRIKQHFHIHFHAALRDDHSCPIVHKYNIGLLFWDNKREMVEAASFCIFLASKREGMSYNSKYSCTFVGWFQSECVHICFRPKRKYHFRWKRAKCFSLLKDMSK